MTTGELFTLQTRYVFIDTSEFVRLNFSYQVSVLKALASLIEKEAAYLCITELTVDEIKSNIAEELRNAENAAAKFRTRVKILRNVSAGPYTEVFREVDSKAVSDELTQQLNDFLGGYGVTH
jgi:hypothetical protein